MATYDGTQWPSARGINTAGNIGATSVNQDAGLFLDRGILSGPRTFVVPRFYPGLSFSGTIYETFHYIFYNRIHLFPNPLNFGPILSSTTREVEIWNAFYIAKTLTAQALVTLPGVTSTPTLPMSFAALQAIRVPITASLDGPPDINGVINYTFTTPTLVETLQVVGTRSFVVPFRHNWDTGDGALPVERLAWLSQVHSGLSAKEQRITLRQNPRREVELNYLLKDAKSLAIFKAQIYFGQPFQFAVPMWQDANVLDAPVIVGANSLSVNTVGRDYDANKSLMIWRDADRFEVITVASLTTTSITLAGLTSFDWRKGDYVVPVRRCILLQAPTDNQIVDRVGKATMVWQVVPEEVSTNRFITPTLPSYRGLPVILKDSEASEDLVTTQDRKIVVIDNSTGIITTITQGEKPQPTFDYRRVLRDRADFADFLGLLYLLKGKRSPMWFPTFRFDFNVTTDLQAADVNLVVNDWGYVTYYNVAQTRRDIVIITKAGQYLYRRINSAALSAGNTVTLTLDAAIGQTLPVSQIDRVCFLRCARLAADEVQFTFETDQTARAVIRFTEQTTTP